MYPNPWATSVQPPNAVKSTVNSYENNTQPYPYYATPNHMQNVINMNQQNSVPLNTTPMTTSLQPNAIDPAMVQKWQEWKRWELWQQQFQQWQQQTGQITAATTQPAPPPMPPSQPSQTLLPPSIPFQNHQYPFNQTGPPLPPTQLPIANQLQQTNIRNEVGIKRGLEPEFQNNEKKLKIDTSNNKKEIELNDETEALFEEQFKSWEEQFFKWKEQNKDHPDKSQYLEYEKKWLNWRDQLKQKCEVLKKKRELKLIEKKKETVQVEENKITSQPSSCFDSMMSNEPTGLQHMHNNSSMVPPTTENQIPGLDLACSNENINKGFLNVSRIIPNQNGPIQTPDDKPFNFPKSCANPPPTIIPNPINMPSGSINQPSPSIYQNSTNWSSYNNSAPFYNQKPPNIDNTPVTRFNQTDISNRPPLYGGETSNTTYNSIQNNTNMNYRRPLDRPYNNPLSETHKNYNNSPDDQQLNRHFNSSNNFRGYSQPNSNTSNFNNYNRQPEKPNVPYQQSSLSLNTTPAKPPSLLSLNLVKPTTLDKPGNYSDKNDAPNRYERKWNIADEEDDPENDYMEAHNKFCSEPFDDQNNDNQFSNTQRRNVFNENNYSRGQHDGRNFNNDYVGPSNQTRGSQMMRNTENDYSRPNSQISRNNQNYSHDVQTLKNTEDNYYKHQNNVRNMDQRFPKEASLSNDHIDEEYSNEHIIDANNLISKRGDYGPSSRGNFKSSRGNYEPFRGNYGPSRGNYGSSRGNGGNRDSFKSNFGNNNTNKTNMDWDENYKEDEEPRQPPEETIDLPPVIKRPYEAPPIDPIKIFDYRHLPTLKVIPGLSRETVIPIRVYDYKHGGKRILPWQDRGYSRRNGNQSRDLQEKEVSNQELNDSENNRKTSINKSTFNLNDTSSDTKNTSLDIKDPSLDVKDTLLDFKEKHFVESRVDEVIKVQEDKTPSTVDNDNIILDDKFDQNQEDMSQHNINILAPSPPKMSNVKEDVKPYNRKLLTIETLLCPPGRLNRPSKIVIILRGLPGSGKSHVAKLIKEKEVSMGGQAPRILSLDDYFMNEVTKIEIDPETNKKVEKKIMEYEHDSANESLYRTSFIKAFKKKISENYFSFFIIDAINNKVSYYKDIINISRCNGFTVYIIELESDVDLCIKQNIHNRTAHDINSIMRSWVKTPDDQILLDIRSLLHSPSKSEMEMEDVSDVEMELDRDEEVVDDNKLEDNENVDFEEEDVMKLLSCKWTDTIPQEEKMKRLDGLCKKKSESSIKEWLQIPEDNYSISEQVVVKDGKKRVRWADMEERREQEKMRAIGFVVGQTDWDRMLGRDQESDHQKILGTRCDQNLSLGVQCCLD